MSTAEFSYPVKANEVGGRARAHEIAANAEERAALATRFDLLSLGKLAANLTLAHEARGIRLSGEVTATGVQACVATGAPLPFKFTAPVSLLLVQDAPAGEDRELDAADLDVEPLEGDIIDLGEWAAQALGLALNPFPRSKSPAPGVLSEAEATAARSPFAMLRKP